MDEYKRLKDELIRLHIDHKRTGRGFAPTSFEEKKRILTEQIKKIERRMESDHAKYISTLRRERRMPDINPERFLEINPIIEKEDKIIEMKKQRKKVYAEFFEKSAAQAAAEKAAQEEKIEQQKSEKIEKLEKEKLKKEEEMREKGDWKKQAEKQAEKVSWYLEEYKKVKEMSSQGPLSQIDSAIQKMKEQTLNVKLQKENPMVERKVKEAKKMLLGGKTKKISAVEKRLKTRCIRYRKGKCIRYTKKQLKLIMALRKDYKAQKKTHKRK